MGAAFYEELKIEHPKKVAPSGDNAHVLLEIWATGAVVGVMLTITALYVWYGEADWLYPWMIASWVFGSFAIGRLTKT